MKNDPVNSPKLVRDLMTVGVPTCPLDTLITDLTQVMLEKDHEGFIVLDKQGHAAGVITQNELIAAYASGRYQELIAEDIMQMKVPQVPPDIPLTAAAQIMQDWDVRVLFLMHHAAGIEYPAAVITYKHILRHIAMKEVEDLADLGIYAARKSPVELFIERRDTARDRARLGQKDSANR